MSNNLCLVCGYDGLKFPPDLGVICPCCGTEYGLSDEERTHRELLHRWLASGATWWSRTRKPPIGWSPLAQLRNVSYEPTPEERAAIVRTAVPPQAREQLSKVIP